MPTRLEELTLCSTEVRLLVFSMLHLHFSVFTKHYSSEWGSKCGEDKNVRYIYLVSASRDLHSICGTLITACYIGNEGAIKGFLGTLFYLSCFIEMVQTVNT